MCPSEVVFVVDSPVRDAGCCEPRCRDSADGPVAWLRKVHNASVFVRATSTPKPFLMAITHHTVDPDVSAMLWHHGAMEGGITRVGAGRNGWDD